jgi:hypothetical protein
MNLEAMARENVGENPKHAEDKAVCRDVRFD